MKHSFWVCVSGVDGGTESSRWLSPVGVGAPPSPSRTQMEQKARGRANSISVLELGHASSPHLRRGRFSFSLSNSDFIPEPLDPQTLRVRLNDTADGGTSGPVPVISVLLRISVRPIGSVRPGQPNTGWLEF